MNRVTICCAFCGEYSQRVASRTRNGDHRRKMRMYCSQDHYMAALARSNYVPWRQGGRIARAAVAKHFPLEDAHIVHHKDDNQRHNELSNLAVFASHAEHMAHHRGRPVVPLWDGATAPLKEAAELSDEPFTREQKDRLRARRLARRRLA